MLYLIYMLREEGYGPVKIGKSSEHGLITRISEIQTGNSRQLLLMRTILIPHDDNRGMSPKKTASVIEGAMHFYFRSLHIRGEWFYWSDEMMTVQLNNMLCIG